MNNSTMPTIRTEHGQKLTILPYTNKRTRVLVETYARTQSLKECYEEIKRVCGKSPVPQTLARYLRKERIRDLVLGVMGEVLNKELRRKGAKDLEREDVVADLMDIAKEDKEVKGTTISAYQTIAKIKGWDRGEERGNIYIGQQVKVVEGDV